MADLRYLKQRRQTWYFRLTVPADLRVRIGRSEIVTTLETRDLAVAQSRRWKERERWERFFSEMRAPNSETPREAYDDILSYARELGVDDHAEYGDFSKLDMWRDALLEEHARLSGVHRLEDAPPPGPSLKAKLDALEDRRREVSGRRPRRRRAYGMTVRECGQAWIEENRHSLTEQTIGQYEAVIRLFSEHFGDRPMNEVTRADVADFIDVVAAFDPHWGRSPKTKTRSLDDLRSIYGGTGKRLANRTLNRYLSAISQAWHWAKLRDEAEGENPTAGLFRPTRGKETSTYHAMPIEALNALFKPPEPTFRPLWEVAAVALYSGLRLNEICALDWADVRTGEGITYFDVTASKTEAGVRKVPVHSRLGWLLSRRQESGPIWQELKPGGPDQKPSWYLSRRFGTFKRDRGITDRRLVFHSLRKNFVQCLERAGVEQSRAAQIVGHESQGITYRVYNPAGLSMQQRQETVELVQYPELILPKKLS